MNDRELLNKAKDLLESKVPALSKKYHIDNVGVGYKTEEGKITRKIAIIFYVDKNNVQTMKTIKNLPKEIEGIPVDVVEMEGGFELR